MAILGGMKHILGPLLALLAFALPASAADDGILIFGATGRSGSELAKQLVARGEKVTAFVRATSNREPLAGVKVDYAVGDATKAEDVAAAFKGKSYRVVIEAVQSRRGEPTPYEATVANIVPLAKQSGVKQVIMYSTVAVDHTPTDMPQFPWGLYPEVVKQQTAAEHKLRESGVGYTIIRIGALLTSRDKPPHPPTGKSMLTEDQLKFGATTYGDLVAQTAACVDAARCMNKVFVIADDSLAGEMCRMRAKDPAKDCP